jgi:class III cytochrome C family protein
MKREFLLILILSLCTLFGNAISVSGEGATDDVMCIPMGDILLGPPESVEAKKTAVTFPHARHFGFECKSCHHQWTGTAQIQNCMASGCHDLKTSPKKTDVELPVSKYYKAAFHDLCIGCHKKIKMQNKKLEASPSILDKKLPKSGPTGCIKCHPRD